MNIKNISISIGIISTLVLMTTAWPVLAADEVITENINWQPWSDYDSVINRAGSSITTNVDSWGAWKPNGVYAGSYTPESEFQLDMMMLQWFEENITTIGVNIDRTTESGRYAGKVVLAQKVMYGANVIMSGVSQFYVRLPIRASHFIEGMFYMYESRLAWDMEIENIYAQDYPVSGENTTRWYHGIDYDEEAFEDYRFRYEQQKQEVLIAESYWNAFNTIFSDIYPYTYNDRVYVPLKAPLKPDTYYTMVTTAYANETFTGGETNIFLSKDGISMVEYNDTECLIAYATDTNVNTINYEIHLLPINLGYSFVFNQGYGDRISGYETTFDDGDKIVYTVNLNNTNESEEYASLMFPFLEDEDGNDITVDYYLLGLNEDDEYTETGLTGNDFILQSFDDDTVEDNDRWRVEITLNGSANIGLFLTEPTDNDYTSDELWASYEAEYWQYNQDTGSATGGSIDRSSSFYIETVGGSLERIFFNIFAPLQFGEGTWDYTIPNVTKFFEPSDWIKFADKVFYGACKLFVYSGYAIPPIGFAISYVFGGPEEATNIMHNLIKAGIYTAYSTLEAFIGATYDVLQDIFDNVKDALALVGEFVVRVADSIVTSITWLAEKIDYYSSQILEIFTKIVFPFLVFCGIIYLWGWFLTAMLKLVIGDILGFKEEFGKPIRTTASKLRRLK